jgi:nucleoside-diphosphate-sugar epimerase
MGEHAVLRYARRTGLPTVTVRPAFVYGPHSSSWTESLYNLCLRYPVPLINGGTGSAHPIYIEDVVDLLVTAATHPDAPGHAFNAAPDPAPTWRDFLGAYARMAYNKSTINIPLLPDPIIKPAADLISALLGLNGDHNDVFGVLHYLASHFTYSMESAATILNWRPRYSLEAGMAITERWLKLRDEPHPPHR